jgi:hypothetical protein
MARALSSVNLHKAFFCLYKLEHATKKAGKGEKRQSDLFLHKKVDFGLYIESKGLFGNAFF